MHYLSKGDNGAHILENLFSKAIVVMQIFVQKKTDIDCVKNTQREPEGKSSNPPYSLTAPQQARRGRACQVVDTEIAPNCSDITRV